MLFADAIVEKARDLAQAKIQERIRMKRSTDWFDRLVVERYRLDEERRKAEQKD